MADLMVAELVGMMAVQLVDLWVALMAETMAAELVGMKVV